FSGFGAAGTSVRALSGEQLGNERLQLGTVGAVSPRAAQDPEQVDDGIFEGGIDHDAVELGVMRHIGYGIPQAALDDLGAVGLSIAQPGFQLPSRWRQDEDGLAV